MIIILFMYIFMIPLKGNLQFITSNIVVGFILSVYFIINSRYRGIVIRILKNKRVLFIFSFLIIIIMYSLFIPTLLRTYDYSIIKTLINQLINLIIGILIYSLYYKKNDTNKILQNLIYVFIFQSVIQIVSFVSPGINDFLNHFRTDDVILRGQLGYGGIRGLSISGSAFFGLAVSYGLIIIYYLDNWTKLFPKYPILRIVFFASVLFGAISSARISLVGLILGSFYVLISWILKYKHGLRITKFSKRSYKSIVITTLLVLIIIYITQTAFNNDRFIVQFERFQSFALEIFKTTNNSGRFSTSSTDVLFGKMYFPIDFKTFVIGDGMYSNSFGSYYMGTDAGYMRNILFFGVIGILLLFCYQILFFDWRWNKNNLRNIFIMFFILISHIKGETLGFLIMMQNMLFILHLRNCILLNQQSIEHR